MKIITAFFISFILSLILTFPTIHLAKKFNLVTDKRKRKHPAHTHSGIIPRAGGLPIYLSLLITIFLIIPLNKILTGILIASFLLVVLGLLDDYYDLSPYHRFIANLLISTLVIGFGLGIPYISNPFGGVIRLDQYFVTINLLGDKKILYLADLLAIIWLTLTTNLINWSKGVDGQMPGFVAIAAIFLGILSQRFTAHDISVEATTLLSFAVGGAFLGFLPWNFYPQKIMPGYSGGALAGFLLGILSILSFGKLGTFILILSIPIIDGLYTIVRRILQKKSPFRADWGHFHHRLLEIGWGKRRIAVFYWLITLILGFASLFLNGWEKLIFSTTIALLLVVFVYIIEKIKIPNNNY
jgi:UDP-GlcNAc:undecaprenyl-phosphate GlcNAc-1-phosphate transferase